MELSDRLKQLRTEKGLTMDMLVWDMNTRYSLELNKGLVSRWENGINEPSLRYAAYLAMYFDVSLDYLTGLTDVKTPARLLAYASKRQPEETPTPHALKLNHPRPYVSPERPTQKLRSLSKGQDNLDDDDFEFEFLNLDDNDSVDNKRKKP